MNLYWVRTQKDPQLAIVPRPRGGDWLENDLAVMRREGIDVLVSLLTSPEQNELGLVCEADECAKAGITYLNFAIPDREVPQSRRAFVTFLEEAQQALKAGKRVGAHCRAGIGRSSLLIASLLCSQGFAVEDAFRSISEARGLAVPDTPEQVAWVAGLYRR